MPEITLRPDTYQIAADKTVAASSSLDAGAAQDQLKDIRGSLMTAQNTLRSGYLSLQSSSDGQLTMESRSRLNPFGDKQGAATFVRELINKAYGDQIGRMDVVSKGHLHDAIENYLQAKGGKLGTSSFVKLLDTLESASAGATAWGAAPARGSIALEGSRLNFSDQALSRREQSGLNTYQNNPKAYQITERPTASPVLQSGQPDHAAGARFPQSLNHAVGSAAWLHQSALSNPSSALSPWRRSVEMNQLATLAGTPVANPNDIQAENGKTIARLDALILAEIPGLPPGTPGGLAALDSLPPALLGSPAGIGLTLVVNTAKELRAQVETDGAIARSLTGAEEASRHLEAPAKFTSAHLAKIAGEAVVKLGDGQGLRGDALAAFTRLKAEASDVLTRIQANAAQDDLDLPGDDEEVNADDALQGAAIPDEVQNLRDLHEELQGCLEELQATLLSLNNPAKTKEGLSVKIAMLSSLATASTDLGRTTQEAIRLLEPLVRQRPAGGEANGLQEQIKVGHDLFKRMDLGMDELTPANVAVAMKAFDALKALETLGQGRDQVTVRPIRDFVGELLSPRNLSGTGDASRLLELCNSHIPLLKELSERPDLLSGAGLPPELSQGLAAFLHANSEYIQAGALPPTDDLMAPLAAAIDTAVTNFKPDFLAAQLTLTSPATQKHTFLATVFAQYYAKSDLQDQKAMVASLLRECAISGAAATPPEQQQQMLALVKGAGPLLQKYLQQFAESFSDPNVQALMKAVKHDLSPIPTDLRNAALSEIIEHSQRTGRPIAGISELRDLGAASIAQAFKMTLNYSDGRQPASQEVVVKLLRPGLAQRAAREDTVLAEIAQSCSSAMLTEFRDFSTDVQDEMLMKKEHANLERAGRFNPSLFATLTESTSVRAVKAHASSQASDSYVMMELAPGETMSECIAALSKSKPAPGDHAAIRARLDQGAKLQAAMLALSAKWFEEGLLGSGFFHGDLHGGNIMFAADGTDQHGNQINANGLLTMIDFGNAHELQTLHKEVLMGLFVGLIAGNVDAVMSNLDRLLPPDAQAKLNAPDPNNLSSLLSALHPGTVRDSAMAALGEQLPMIMGSVAGGLPDLGGVDLAALAKAVNTNAQKFATSCERWSTNSGGLSSETVHAEISAASGGRKSEGMAAALNKSAADKAFLAAQNLPLNNPLRATYLAATTTLRDEASKVVAAYISLNYLTQPSFGPADPATGERERIPPAIHLHMCGEPNATRNNMLISNIQRDVNRATPEQRMNLASKTLESIVDALNVHDIAVPPAFAKFVKSQGMLERAIDKLGAENRTNHNLLPENQRRTGEDQNYQKTFYAAVNDIYSNPLNVIRVNGLLGSAGRAGLADARTQQRAAQAGNN